MLQETLVNFIPAKYVYYACGILLSLVVAMISLGARKVLDEVDEAKGKISAISTELTLQRTNCLTTLQQQGEKQIQLLERIAESVSYLKGKNDQ
jgi:hypothetical protein